MRSWIRYWIAIPIACAIKNRLSLYEVYSQAWELNNIHLGRYRFRYDPNYKLINKKGKL
jgi:hypothetical protein